VLLAGASIVIYGVVVQFVDQHAANVQAHHQLGTVLREEHQNSLAQLANLRAQQRVLNQLDRTPTSSPRYARLSRLAVELRKQGQQLVRASLNPLSFIGLSSAVPANWFRKLQPTFSNAAAILAALILALVFSRRRSRIEVDNEVFRVVLLIGVIGLLAATIGMVPSVPAWAQAVLLAYTIYGFVGSVAAVALIAGDWIA
jgi:hypothetical protein